MGFPLLLTKVREFLGSVLPFLDKVLWFYWWLKALILSKLMMPAAADKASFRIFAEYSKFIMQCGASSHPRSPSPAPRHSPPRYSFNVVIPIWNHHSRLFNKFISLKTIVLKSYSSWLLSFLSLHQIVSECLPWPTLILALEVGQFEIGWTEGCGEDLLHRNWQPLQIRPSPLPAPPSPGY